MGRYDEIEVVKKHDKEAKSFDEVLKFNPYHGYHGYFSTAQGATSMTIRTRDPNKQSWADAAIAREKERNTPKGKPLGRFQQGDPMTHEQANEGHVNPHYDISAISKRLTAARDKHWEMREKYGWDSEEAKEAAIEYQKAADEYNRAVSDKYPYTMNCQSCVLAYEARLRGYDVTAKPWDKKNALQKQLAGGQENGYYDPDTGNPPLRPKADKRMTSPKTALSALESTVKQGERYTMGHLWKGRSRDGHIISVDRDGSGNLRLYDPQSGKTMTGSAINKYLNDVKYKTTHYGKTYPCGPKLLRVDNLEIDPNMANAVLTEARK